MLSLLSAAVVNRESALQVGIDPRWAPLAMLVTQDIALKLQFRQQLVLTPSPYSLDVGLRAGQWFSYCND